MTILFDELECTMRSNQNIALSHSEIEFLGDHFSTLGKALKSVADMKGISEQDRSEYAQSLIEISEDDVHRVRYVQEVVCKIVRILGVEKSEIS